MPEHDLDRGWIVLWDKALDDQLSTAGRLLERLERLERRLLVWAIGIALDTALLVWLVSGRP